ncbi:MAG: hypothetical protein J4428_00955 [Candidatus Aenigmarchaeota archaeon]|nr:hypothetical protein [Candidatus Aenigmarchaeota archaeon]
MIKKILVFGNMLIKKDNLPLKMMGDLKKSFPQIEFKEFDPSENLKEEGRELYIIDTVEGIEKVEIITNFNDIKLSKIYSVHDFDLGYELKLLKKSGMIDKVTIFGVPMNLERKNVFNQLKEKIKSFMNSK